MNKSVVFAPLDRGLRFCSHACLVVNGCLSRTESYLERSKNRYFGERCFIIGNGPSLNGADLDRISGIPSFASNRIYNIFPETSWRPTYYAVFDEGVARREGVVDGINSFGCEMKFVREQGYLKAYRRLTGDICYLHAHDSRKYLEDPKFSTDLRRGVYTIATVTYTLMQIAYHMGFRNMYLLGVDHKYAKTVGRDGIITENDGVRSYFGADGSCGKNMAGASWEMDIAYDYAERISHQLGFRIYNATRGGCLETFERVDFDDVVG